MKHLVRGIICPLISVLVVRPMKFLDDKVFTEISRIYHREYCLKYTGAVIAAGAIVTESFSRGTVVMGIPARAKMQKSDKQEGIN